MLVASVAANDQADAADDHEESEDVGVLLHNLVELGSPTADIHTLTVVLLLVLGTWALGRVSKKHIGSCTLPLLAIF
jgi:hypothetical protein